MADEDPPNIIPFGKHKGKTVEEIRIAEPGYLDWLEGQPWFRDKFVVLHQTIINRGAEPEETPDHNALQVLFLEDAFCLKVVAVLGYNPENGFNKWKQEAIDKLKRGAVDDQKRVEEYEATIASYFERVAKGGKSDYSWEKSYQRMLEDKQRTRDQTKLEITKKQSEVYVGRIENRAFEAQGWDVVFEASFAGRFTIEIKPSVGDDYPAILRQINALRHRNYGNPVLFLERYIGVGATHEQFVAIFKQAGIQVVFRDQVDERR